MMTCHDNITGDRMPPAALPPSNPVLAAMAGLSNDTDAKALPEEICVFNDGKRPSPDWWKPEECGDL